MTRAAGDDPFYTFYLNGDIDGPSIKLVSVTTVIKRVLAVPALVPWAYKLGTGGGPSPKEVRDERSREGRAAHDFLELLAKGELDEGMLAHVMEQGTPYERAILKWWRKKKRVVQGAEMVVVSLNYRYAGTADLLLRAPSGLTLIDLKTRKAGVRKAYESDLIQVAAYRLAYEEFYGEPVLKSGVLLARNDGSCVYDERHVSSGLFLDLLRVYNGLKEAKL